MAPFLRPPRARAATPHTLPAGAVCSPERTPASTRRPAQRTAARPGAPRQQRSPAQLTCASLERRLTQPPSPPRRAGAPRRRHARHRPPPTPTPSHTAPPTERRAAAAAQRGARACGSLDAWRLAARLLWQLLGGASPPARGGVRRRRDAGMPLRSCPPLGRGRRTRGRGVARAGAPQAPELEAELAGCLLWGRRLSQRRGTQRRAPPSPIRSSSLGGEG